MLAVHPISHACRALETIFRGRREAPRLDRGQLDRASAIIEEIEFAARCAEVGAAAL